ncbi:hypothetical protein HYU23_02385, partial [Candidatus Woesearchaeota archaeon]|nr:hypothetical protein [Candidatus Woesearchaeota archaeon]
MKKRVLIRFSMIAIMAMFMVGFAFADIPSQGSHDGTWGSHLNDWLNISHNLTSGLVYNYTDASIILDDLAQASVNLTHLAMRSVNVSHLTQASVNLTHLALNAVNTSHVVVETLTLDDIANR